MFEINQTNKKRVKDRGLNMRLLNLCESQIGNLFSGF